MSSAAFFGEIVEPASRAFLDLGEDADFEQSPSSPDVEFSVSWNNDDKPKCDLLLLFHGSLAAAFADQHLTDNSNKCGSVRKTEGAEAASLHKLGGGTTICCRASTVPDIHSVAFVNAISELVKSAERVVIVCSVSISRFLGEPTHEDGLLRCLTSNTSIDELGLKCPQLEQPNFVYGLPASILTFCRILGKKTWLLACYGDDDPGRFDSRTMAPLEKFRDSKLLQPLRRPTSKSASSGTGPSSGNIYT